MNPKIEHFYHATSGTLSYVVSDPQTSAAAIIDPVLEFSVVSGRTDTGPADLLIDYLRENKLDLHWILETHAHADHLSAAQHVKAELGGRLAIGKGIRDVQKHFGPVFNLRAPFKPDGSQFDQLLADGDRFSLGKLECTVLATPGHTSDSVTYLIGNAAFVGDSLFMTDSGTARCDFPGGDAGSLYDSIQKLFALPDDTVLHLCHDYPPDGRDVCYRVTVAEQKQKNIHVGRNRDKASFIALREARDETLSLPKLIVPSIQVNIRAGELPPEDDNGIAYIRIPLNQL